MSLSVVAFPVLPFAWGNVASVNGGLIAIVAPGTLVVGARFGIFRPTGDQETPVADVVRERWRWRLR